MKKKKYRNKLYSLFKFFAVSRHDIKAYGLFLIILISFISIGYAAFNQHVDILNSTALMRPDKLLRITNITFNQALSSPNIDSIQDYSVDNVGITVDLPNADSFATYDIQINNRKFNDVGIFQITNLPSNIDYQILNYTLGDKLCDSNGNCNVSDIGCTGSSCVPIVTSNVQVKFFYKDGGYNPNNISQNILAKFDFRDIHNISYSGFDNSLPYPKYIIDGGTVTVTFNQFINNVSILMDNIPLGSDEFTISNNVLTIPNVTGDLVITNLSYYTIIFDNMGGINGPASQNVYYSKDVLDVTPPTREGYSFAGYYKDLNPTSIYFYVNNYGSTYRIESNDEPKWYKNTALDAGRLLQTQFVLTDNTLSAAPSRVEFNDRVINSDYYTITKLSDHSWRYDISFAITTDMVTTTSYPYETNYRFFDIEGVTSSTTVSVNYIWLDDGYYFDKNGKTQLTEGLKEDVTVYAKWVDDVAPKLTLTTTHGINSGDTYTQYSWTNRTIYTNITVEEKGSGLNNNLIQYSYDNINWNTFSFGARNLNINNGIYTGSEEWTIPNKGNLRIGDVFIRACDNVGLCDTKEYHFRYDNQDPVISSVSYGYPSGTSIQIIVNASDGSGSGIKEYKFARSDTNSCNGVTWGSSNTFTGSNFKYFCVKAIDNAGNETTGVYPVGYLVTASSNGGSINATSGWSGSGNTATKTYSFGSTYGTLPTASKIGYVYKGWTQDDNYLVLDYITTDGYIYIDTGFADPNGIRAEYKAIFLDNAGGYIIGSHNEASPYGRNGAYWSQRTQWEMGYGEICPGLGSGQPNVAYEVDFKTTYNDAYIKVKEAGSSSYIVNSSYSGQRISTYNNYLFWNEYSENIGGLSTKATVYYVKLYNSSGTLVRDFIPVKRASDGLVGFYDKVNDVFYTSKRPGVYTAGPTTDMIISSDSVRQCNHTIYAVYADETAPTISSVNISSNTNGSISVTVSANDNSGIGDYSYAFNSSNSCPSTLSYIRASNSFTIETVANNYLCIRTKDTVGNTSYKAQVVPYVVGFSDPNASNMPSSVTSNTNTVTLPSTVPTRANSTFLGWSTTNGATTAQYSPGQTITLSSRRTTLYAVWKTFTWDVYGISYVPYDTGEKWDWNLNHTGFYVATSYTNNNNGTVHLNMNKKIEWSLFGGGNQGAAAGNWVGTGYISSGTTGTMVEDTDTFFYIRGAGYWVPTFTINLTTWKIRKDKGAATGETVTSTYNNAYPSNGEQDGKYYVLR